MPGMGTDGCRESYTRCGYREMWGVLCQVWAQRDAGGPVPGVGAGQGDALCQVWVRGSAGSLSAVTADTVGHK